MHIHQEYVASSWPSLNTSLRLRWQHLQLVKITAAHTSSVASACAASASWQDCTIGCLLQTQAQHAPARAVEEARSERRTALQLHGPMHGLVYNPHKRGHAKGPQQMLSSFAKQRFKPALWPCLGVIITGMQRLWALHELLTLTWGWWP